MHGRSAPLIVLATAVLVAGCVTSRPAPVSERTPPTKQSATAVQPAPQPLTQTQPAAQAKREFYTVKPGDTLYSIALEHGLDYRELAIWNGLDNPAALRVGQQLRVTAPASAPLAVVAAPLKSPAGTIQARPLDAAGAPTPASPVPAPPAAAGPGSPAPPAAVVSEPKGIRLPYSEQALAQLAKGETPAPKPEARVEVKPPSRPDAGADARSVEASDWIWPVKGKVVATFNGTTNKGIDIAGRRGQPIIASAGGRVIFSGTGVRGMGKFVVIKHSEELISVYGHNDQVVVKYGQSVAKGQKIAEMGSTDADQVKLHFEIRRHGAPVDPLKLLPEGPV